jgi:hypothetical protein
MVAVVHTFNRFGAGSVIGGHKGVQRARIGWYVGSQRAQRVDWQVSTQGWSALVSSARGHPAQSCSSTLRFSHHSTGSSTRSATAQPPTRQHPLRVALSGTQRAGARRSAVTGSASCAGCVAGCPPLADTPPIGEAPGKGGERLDCLSPVSIGMSGQVSMVLVRNRPP